MIREMKFDVATPAHNEEKTIGQCLSSILTELEGKSYDVEIIVVNNASTDGTRKIAQGYSIVLVAHESKKGLVARHAVSEKATGELVANIDADTRPKPGWIEKVLRKFEEDPNLV